MTKHLNDLISFECHEVELIPSHVLGMSIKKVTRACEK